MSTVIKASENASIQAAAFNFDDMASKAEAYLKKVRAEAAEIVAKARKQAEQETVAIRAKADAEARKAAQASIEKVIQERVQQQVAQQIDTLLPALRKTIAEVEHARQAWLAHWEKRAIHVSAAIAQRVIRRELTVQPEASLSLVREALELAAGSTQVRLRMHPADCDSLRPHLESLIKEFSRLGTPELIADPQVSPGGCVVETKFGVIDQQIESQLARIEEELA